MCCLNNENYLNTPTKQPLNIYVMQNIVVAFRQAEFHFNPFFFPFQIKATGQNIIINSC